MITIDIHGQYENTDELADDLMAIAIEIQNGNMGGRMQDMWQVNEVNKLDEEEGYQTTDKSEGGIN